MAVDARQHVAQLGPGIDLLGLADWICLITAAARSQASSLPTKIQFFAPCGSPHNANNALIEAYEESGLKVRLIRHLVDVKRSQSYTRYNLAQRVAGNPADMGWETQAVMLVPPQHLAQVVTHPNDAPILQALAQL